MSTLRNLHFDKISQCADCFRILTHQQVCLGICAQEKNFREQLQNVLSYKGRKGDKKLVKNLKLPFGKTIEHTKEFLHNLL